MATTFDLHLNAAGDINRERWFTAGGVDLTPDTVDCGMLFGSTPRLFAAALNDWYGIAIYTLAPGEGTEERFANGYQAVAQVAPEGGDEEADRAAHNESMRGLLAASSSGASGDGEYDEVADDDSGFGPDDESGPALLVTSDGDLVARVPLSDGDDQFNAAAERGALDRAYEIKQMNPDATVAIVIDIPEEG